MRSSVGGCTIVAMHIHPAFHLQIAHERQRDLLAQAERYRLGRTARRSAEEDTTNRDLRPTTDTVRELAHRREAGIDVTLLWSSPANELTVTVADLRTGNLLVLPADHDNALDVFYHPYAHASQAA